MKREGILGPYEQREKRLSQVIAHRSNTGLFLSFPRKRRSRQKPESLTNSGKDQDPHFRAITAAALFLVLVLCTESVFAGGLFQYGVWRSDDRIVTAPYVDGFVAYFHWNSLEQEQGKCDLEPISRIRSRAVTEGKKFILRVVTAEHTPKWVYKLGVPKVIDKSDAKPAGVPLYWHPLYLERLRVLIGRIASNFDGDPSLAAVQIGVARYGETLLGGRDWLDHGFSSSQWDQACRTIIEIYKEHFKKTPLIAMIMSPELPGGRRTDSMRAAAAYAASKGITLQFNGLSPDNSYLWGLLEQPDRDSAVSLFREFRTQVPISFEFTNDKAQPRLSCMNALSEGASYLSVHTSILEDMSLQDLFSFTHYFLGKNPQTAGAVWTLLRQTFPNDHIRTGKKNYEFGMHQVEVNDVSLVQSGGTDFIIRAKTSAMAEMGGFPCRRTDAASHSHHIVFTVSPDFDAGSHPVLSVVYADVGQDALSVLYMNGDGLSEAGIIQKGGTGKWLRADFGLPGFATGSLPAIILDSKGDGDEYIHYVQLTRSGSSAPFPFSREELSP